MKPFVFFTPLFLLAACTTSPLGLKEPHALQPGVGIYVERNLLPPPEIVHPKKRQEVVTTSYAEEVKKLQVPVESYTVNTQQDNELVVGKRNTRLHIKANSLVDKYGQVCTGKVNIHFKEFTNSAEMAFSGIPMVYRTGKDELRMNSAGMFEITATDARGEEIFIGKDQSIQVDYKLVKKVPNNRFYRLDAKNNTWVEVSKIGGRDTAKNMNPVLLKDNITGTMKLEKLYEGSTLIYRANQAEIANGNQGNQPVNFREVDPGPLYTDLVNGLAVSRFGIYNCDQVYRLDNPVTINATYIDVATKKELVDLQVLSLIDLSYNGAFSYDPRKFTCNSQAKNVLLLFSKSGELYYMDEKKLSKVKLVNNGSFTFKMTNITSQIKGINDLKSLLNI
jgi:hypothetical protein